MSFAGHSGKVGQRRFLFRAARHCCHHHGIGSDSQCLFHGEEKRRRRAVARCSEVGRGAITADDEADSAQFFGEPVGDAVRGEDRIGAPFNDLVDRSGRIFESFARTVDESMIEGNDYDAAVSREDVVETTDG